MVAAVLEAANDAEVAAVFQPANTDRTADRLARDDPVVCEQRIAALLVEADAHQLPAAARAELAGIVLEADDSAQLVVPLGRLEVGSALEDDGRGGQQVRGRPRVALLSRVDLAGLHVM